jgi:hypothetical protein
MLRFFKIQMSKNVAQQCGFGRYLLLTGLALLLGWIPSKAQETDTFKPGSELNESTELTYDFAQNHFYLGYRYLPVEKKFMQTFLDRDDIPTLDFQLFLLTLGYSLYRDWWYADANFSLILSQEQSLDSLRSRLDQNSLAVRFGYNLVNQQPWLISPYLGLRRTTYLHLTVPEARSMDLDDYLMTGELDLRISQWSAEVGLQASLLTLKGWSVGIHGAYLLHLHDRPIIRGEETRIRHNAESPVGQFTLGLTFSSFQNLSKQ